jgi:predicted ATPase
MDRLDASEQRILEAASLSGLQFSTSDVAYALALPADDVDSVCEGLAIDGRFLRFVEAESGPDGAIQAGLAEASPARTSGSLRSLPVQSRYDFVHALCRDAALARVRSATRRVWHRRTAEGVRAVARAARCEN